MEEDHPGGGEVFQLYLPDREALKAEIERTLAEVRQ